MNIAKQVKHPLHSRVIHSSLRGQVVRRSTSNAEIISSNLVEGTFFLLLKAFSLVRNETDMPYLLCHIKLRFDESVELKIFFS